MSRSIGGTSHILMCIHLGLSFLQKHFVQGEFMVLSGLTLEKMFGLLNFKGAAPDIKLIFKLYL